MNPQLILVHHPEVESRWRGLCYGRSEARLSDVGAARVPRLVSELADLTPGTVFSSPAMRACAVAEPLAAMANVTLRLDVRLAERDYGTWEGVPWAEIQAGDRGAMRALFDEPDTFSAGGGETLYGVRDRIMAWYRQLPLGDNVVAVSHGTPIGALLGTLQGRPSSEWPALVPPMGDRIRVPLPEQA